MTKRMTLACCVLLALLGCGEEDDPKSGSKGTGKSSPDGDSLREKLDAYLLAGAQQDSVDCECEGGSEDECEVADITSERQRDCYVEEASDDRAAAEAFFDCATPLIESYNECMQALDSCEGDEAAECVDAYADMLRCPSPSRAVILAWRACDEQI